MRRPITLISAVAAMTVAACLGTGSVLRRNNPTCAKSDWWYSHVRPRPVHLLQCLPGLYGQ
jgi:hypothetical protein